MYVKGNISFKVVFISKQRQACICGNISDEISCNRDNNCKNGGTCYGTMLNYQCSCAEGYTGNNCESKN